MSVNVTLTVSPVHTNLVNTWTGTAFRCSIAIARSRPGPVPLPRRDGLQEYAATADTLVIYVYSNTNAEYQRNFHFFFNHGIRPKDGHHYIIVVQDVLVRLLACRYASPPCMHRGLLQTYATLVLQLFLNSHACCQTMLLSAQM